MADHVGHLVVGIFALGMAASFYGADRHSPTSRTISLFFLLQAIAIVMNVPADAAHAQDPAVGVWFARFYSVLDPTCMIVGFEWLLRLGRTENSEQPGTRRGEGFLRAAQAMAALYGLVGIARPDLRLQYWYVVDQRGLFSRPQFYLFAIPFNLAFGLAAVRLVQLLHADLDPAERVRLNAVLVAAPFWAVSVSMPTQWLPLAGAAGLAIFLFGAIRYHVMQGQRGQFLARFLSPEVARLVRDRGLAAATQRNRVEISAVACDLRGFTAFTDSAAPEEVMRLLEQYHDAVAEAVLAHSASIKDFAGDGILALVGAPVAVPDHARRAVAMALAIRKNVEGILGPWRRIGLDLGVGLGVASGFVTVGTIGGRERLEYAAVGPAVNLAARLASRAASGQILAESRVVGLAGDGEFGFRMLESAELKGFARPVAIYSVASAARSTSIAKGVA